MAEELYQMDETLVENLLRLYLDRCKYKHALAFL